MDGDGAKRIATLVRRLAAIRDIDLQVGYVRHEIQQGSGTALAELLHAAHEHAQGREERSEHLLLVLSLAIDDPQLETLREDACRIAREEGWTAAISMLCEAAPRPSDPATQRVPDFGAGRPLTLGERKALARKPDRNLIARVLRDPHPDVVEIVLGNPILTEDDVIRLCAKRPIAEDVLRTVFRHQKWIVRYRVRRTLVRNPHTPVTIAVALAAQLNAVDAKAVAQSPELDPRVRAACRGKPSS